MPDRQIQPLGMSLRRPSRLAVLPALALMLLVFAVPAYSAQQARAAVAKGLVDHRLTASGHVPLDQVAAYADEVAATGATWTRLFVRWNHLQPKAPDPDATYDWDADGDGYDDDYVAELEAVVSALHERGLEIMLCGNDIPQWAANRTYVKKFPTSAVMKTGDRTVMAQFRRFAQFMAGHFKDSGVEYLEVWNEPNLASGIYPQIVRKTAVGPAAYVKMVKTFSAGARAANPSARVIAGSTSRFGSNGTDDGSTSPQWFAKYFKAHCPSRYFDGYSHHPYTKLGSDPRPGVPPREPKKSVTLGNISVLLKIFPTKPFYLTEFCYSTAEQDERDLFCVVVTKADQARYLRQAWAWAGRYRQIKVMMWFLVRDYVKEPVTSPAYGVFTGLQDLSGVRKPAWYAFVGGNAVTAAAPESVAAGETFTVTGRLTARGLALGDTRVLLQRRSLTGTTWTTLDMPDTRTDANGDYAFTTSQTAGKQYRVVWDGVCESRALTVTLQ